MRTHALLKSDNVKTSVELAFQLFFLLGNENRDVEVVEMDKIDFAEVKKRLEKGESVFITHRRKKKSEQVLVASRETEDPWYFTHM
jgi:hypothetical protein